jgi:acetyltransferase-like isoleucine patch superfamily enzyme
MKAKEAKARIREFLEDKQQLSLELELDPGVTDKQIYPRSELRYYFNWLLYQVLRKVPPSKIKNSLFRMTGVKLGKEICLPMDVIFDYRYPDLIEVGDDTLIGGFTQIFGHIIRKVGTEFNFNKPRFANINKLNCSNKNTKRTLKMGRTKIGKRTLIASLADFEPGVHVGNDVIIGTANYVNKDVPDLAFEGSRPNKFIKQLDKSWNYIDRKNPEEYYEQQKRLTKEFLKDKTQNHLPLTYRGTRGNAGNDWYKMRPIWRIYLTSAWIEFLAFLPASSFKNFLYRLTGAKIGKDVKIKQFAYIDHINPELITIKSGSILGKFCYVGAHDFTNNMSALGRPVIGPRAHIKEHAMIQSNVTIGADSIVEAWSFVNKDVPDDTIVRGCPAKPLTHNHETNKS